MWDGAELPGVGGGPRLFVESTSQLSPSLRPLASSLPSHIGQELPGPTVCLRPSAHGRAACLSAHGWETAEEPEHRGPHEGSTTSSPALTRGSILLRVGVVTGRAPPGPVLRDPVCQAPLATQSAPVGPCPLSGPPQASKSHAVIGILLEARHRL